MSRGCRHVADEIDVGGGDQALPPTVIAAELLESTAMPQRRFKRRIADKARGPGVAADDRGGDVRSIQRQHAKSETRLASCATALAEAIGALDRKSLANHIGCT